MGTSDDDDDVTPPPESPPDEPEPEDLTPPPVEPPGLGESNGGGNGNGPGGEGWGLADEGERRIDVAAESMPPEHAADITQEIRAIAETRGDDSQVVDLHDLSPEKSAARAATAPGEPEPVEPLNVDELRDAWPFLSLEERSDGLRILPHEEAEDFFIALPAGDQAAMIHHWRPGLRRQWLRLLEPDDVADVIQAAPEEDRGKLLDLLDAPTRKEVQALLAYAEDEAGGLMNPRYARLRPTMTADAAISYLRRQARSNVETIYYAYVLDREQKLVGVCSFRDLFAADPKKTVDEIMETDIVRVNDQMDQETVSRIFAEHDLTVVPVVDANGVMKGIVTVDDIVDVVQEEATEDAQKFGGMEALDLPYLQSTWRDMLMKRGGWLAILLIGEMFTTTALGYFENELATATVLALFMPLIISSGGNSGSQGSTLVIRAMALGEVRIRDWWRIMRREFVTGLALGTFLGALVMVRILVWGLFGTYGDTYVILAVTVGLSVIAVVMFGTLTGAMLPFLLRWLKLDPASASAPFVATLCDVTGLVIYFLIAKIILTGILL